MDKNERKLFWDTLCSLDGKDLVADRTKLLATIKYPPLLYRYRPINQKSIDALQNNKLFFSSANHYDDPFDTYLRIDWNKVKGAIASIDLKSPGAFTQFKTLCESLNISTDLVESLREKFENLTMDELLESFIQMIEKHIRPKIRQNSFSICFSENPCNENLWLKYADNHAGFCLIYNPYDNDAWLCGKQEKCKSCVVANASKSLYPVYYSKEKYDGTQYAIAQAWFTFMCEGLKNMELAQNFAQNVPMHWESEKVSLIKHKCHEFDEEWRILFGAAPNAGACLRWIPHGVVLGLRTSVANGKLIINAAKQAGVKNIYQAIITPLDELDAIKLTEEQVNQILNS